MTTRDELLAVADRCEREEPHALLDTAISVAVLGPLDLGDVPPRYTSSIDAAMTLVPEGMSWEVRRSGFGDPCQAAIWSPRRAPSDGRDIRINTKNTPALALCAAALRARAADAGEE